VFGEVQQGVSLQGYRPTLPERMAPEIKNIMEGGSMRLFGAQRYPWVKYTPQSYWLGLFASTWKWPDRNNKMKYQGWVHLKLDKTARGTIQPKLRLFTTQSNISEGPPCGPESDSRWQHIEMDGTRSVETALSRAEGHLRHQAKGDTVLKKMLGKADLADVTNVQDRGKPATDNQAIAIENLGLMTEATVREKRVTKGQASELITLGKVAHAISGVRPKPGRASPNQIGYLRTLLGRYGSYEHIQERLAALGLPDIAKPGKGVDPLAGLNTQQASIALSMLFAYDQEQRGVAPRPNPRPQGGGQGRSSSPPAAGQAVSSAAQAGRPGKAAATAASEPAAARAATPGPSRGRTGALDRLQAKRTAEEQRRNEHDQEVQDGVQV